MLFKIGALVEITAVDENDRLHGVHIGDRGTVVEYDSSDDTVLLKLSNKRWWIYAKDLKEV